MAADAQRARGPRRPVDRRSGGPDLTRSALSAPLPCEKRLYDAQRQALHGNADADHPVSGEEVTVLAARVGLEGVSVIVDDAGLAPLHAVADPRSRELRFHPESLVLWIAIHEVTHLLLPPRAAHGPLFVSTMLRLIERECGRRCGDRFQAELLRHAVPMVAVSNDVGIFVLISGDRFVRIRRHRISAGLASRATRFATRAAAERAARQARAELAQPVAIVQLV